MILPRIVALGGIDEDELAFAQAVNPAVAGARIAAGARRARAPARARAAYQCMGGSAKPGEPAQAPLVLGGPASTLTLAEDLARLIEDMATRGVDWRALDGLVPERSTATGNSRSIS